MAEEFQHTRNFNDFLGIDLRSNLIRTPKEFATDGLNFDLNDKNEIVKRKGHHSVLANVTDNRAGMFSFSALDNSFQVENRYLSIEQGSLYRLVPRSFDIEYTGTGVLETKITHDGSDFILTVTKDAFGSPSVSLNGTMGEVGGPEAFPRLSDVTNNINGITDVSVTNNTFSSPTTLSATILQPNVYHSSSSGSVTIYGWERVIVDIAVGASISDGNTKNRTGIASINNVLYMSDGIEEVTKYEGLKIYRTGMPRPAKPVLSILSTATAIEPDDYTYTFSYQQIDHTGNVTQSEFSEEESITVAAGEAVNVTVPMLTSEYNVGVAEVTVAGSSLAFDTNVVLTVASGHNLTSGDIVFIDKHSNLLEVGQAETTDIQIRQARVVSTTSTTITVNVPSAFNTGSTWFVSVGHVISPHLTINIWSKRTGDPVFRLVGEVANDKRVSTAIYKDKLRRTVSPAPAVFGSIFDNPLRPDDPILSKTQPPKGTILSAFRNRLIVSGIADEGNKVSFSSAGFPEQFDKVTGSFILENEVTAIGSSEDHLVIFTESQTYRVTGDLGSTFDIDRISDTIGCVAPDSVVEIEDGRIAFMSNRGPYEVVRGQFVRPLGAVQTQGGELTSRIEPFFNFPAVHKGTGVTQFNITRTEAVKWTKGGKLIFFIPKSDQNFEKSRFGDTVIDFDAFSDGITWVYDYKFGSWLKWNNIGLFGGAFEVENTNKAIDGQLYLKHPNGTTQAFIVVLKDNQVDEDYLDQESAISFQYSTNWDHLNNPSIDKKYNLVNVWSLGRTQSAMDLTVKTQRNFDDSTNDTSVVLNFTNETNLKFNTTTKSAKSMRVVFENAVAKQNVIITGFDTEISAPFESIKE